MPNAVISRSVSRTEMNPASFNSAGSLPSRFRWRVARLSCGLRAIELHEHRIVDLVLKRLGDSDQIRFMRLFTHQRSTPRPMDHRFRGRALVRSPGDPGGVSTFLRGEVITLPQAGKWKRAAYMMRLKPPPEEVWEIRCTDPRPGFEYSDGSPRRTSLLLLERSTGRCLGLPRIRRANWP